MTQSLRPVEAGSGAAGYQDPLSLSGFAAAARGPPPSPSLDVSTRGTMDRPRSLGFALSEALTVVAAALSVTVIAIQVQPTTRSGAFLTSTPQLDDHSYSPSDERRTERHVRNGGRRGRLPDACS